jgi:hypothetical protein
MSDNNQHHPRLALADGVLSVQYTDDNGNPATYPLQQGETFVDGLIQPSGLTPAQAAAALAGNSNDQSSSSVTGSTGDSPTGQSDAGTSGVETDPNASIGDGSGVQPVQSTDDSGAGQGTDASTGTASGTGADAGDGTTSNGDAQGTGNGDSTGDLGTGGGADNSQPADSGVDPANGDGTANGSDQQPEQGGDGQDPGSNQLPAAQTVTDAAEYLTTNNITFVYSGDGTQLPLVVDPNQLATLVAADPQAQAFVAAGAIVGGAVPTSGDGSNTGSSSSEGGSVPSPAPSFGGITLTADSSQDDVTGWLDAHAVPYKLTEKLSDGSVGLPIWIEQGDFDNLVPAWPVLQVLVNLETIQLASVSLSQVGDVTESDNEDVSDVSGSDASNSDQQPAPVPAPSGAVSDNSGDNGSDAAGAGPAIGDDALTPTDGNGSGTGGSSGDQGGVPTPTPAPTNTPAAGSDSGAGTQSPAPGDASPVPSPTPSPTPTPAPTAVIVQPTVNPPPGTAQGDAGRALTETRINQIVWDLIKDCSNTAKNVIEGIYQYIANMRPGMPVKPEEGARHQVMLFRTFHTMFNRVEGDFDPTYRAVLKLVESHSNGVFKETHRFRFLDVPSISMSDADKKAFMRWVTMMHVTAPVQSRQLVLKQIDVSAAMKHGTSEAGRNRVFRFYGK